MNTDQAILELVFQPTIELVSVIRRFISDFYDQILKDPDATYRVAMATHELLENVIKYSSDGQTTLHIAVQPHTLSICVSNRAPPERLAGAVEIINEMHQSTNPFIYYQTMLCKSAKKAIGSGLGLARIYAEGEMEVTCHIVQDQISISAQMRF